MILLPVNVFRSDQGKLKINHVLGYSGVEPAGSRVRRRQYAAATVLKLAKPRFPVLYRHVPVQIDAPNVELLEKYRGEIARFRRIAEHDDRNFALLLWFDEFQQHHWLLLTAESQELLGHAYLVLFARCNG